MKKSVMKKWVAALRSGKYEQGRGGMLKANKYCCLGVLCDLTGGTTKAQMNSGVYPDPYLPVQKYAGMRDPFGTIKFKKGSLSLVILNDNRKRSFKHIAAYIERNWKKL